ncbi:MAG: acyl carrier protein [Parvularculaceae bacterium]
MTQDEIRSQLNEVFRTVLDDPKVEIYDAMTADDHEAWDSLSHINLIVETEKGFGVRIKNAEVARLRNVGDLVALIEKKKAR